MARAPLRQRRGALHLQDSIDFRRQCARNLGAPSQSQNDRRRPTTGHQGSSTICQSIGETSGSDIHEFARIFFCRLSHRAFSYSIHLRNSFQIRRLVLVPSLLRSMLMYLSLRVRAQSYIRRIKSKYWCSRWNYFNRNCMHRTRTMRSNLCDSGSAPARLFLTLWPNNFSLDSRPVSIYWLTSTEVPK